MSILSLQIGQCGNQMGAELFNTVYRDCFGQKQPLSSKERDYIYESSDRFFSTNSRKVDMEEKVITRLRKAMHRSTEWKYPLDNCVTSKGGSGNNWAYGFCVHGSTIMGRVEEAIRKQLEGIDLLDGLLVSMSLAGGTGSGLGTKVLLSLPDMVPKASCLAQLVWPYRRGEVSVQAYNAVLTLGHLLAPATAASLDGLLVHHNDVLHAVCTRRLHASNPGCPIGVDHLNSLAAHQMAGVLQPRSSESRRSLSQTLSEVCGHPDYRLLGLRCLPYFGEECRLFATETWPQLLRHGRQMLLTGAAADDNMDWTLGSGTGALERLRETRIPLVALSAVLRGLDANENSLQLPTTFSRDFGDSLFPQWLPGKPHFHGSSRQFMRYPRSLFVVSNGGGARWTRHSAGDSSNADKTAHTLPDFDPSASLHGVSARAWQMFATKAYLHQYERFGMTQEQLMDCFAVVEQISHCYSSLTWS